MKRTRSALGIAAVCLTWTASPALAQVPDHLKCYKINDPQAKTKYTADLGGLVSESGCTIKVPAITACVPATKTNITPPPPGTGGTGTPNAFGCYKVKCPKATLPPLTLNDQFGSRVVTPSAPKLLCAPVAPPTTTTTTTSTTTTTLPPCPNEGSSCGTCGRYGTCVTHCGVGGLVCLNGAGIACGNIGCASDASCLAGTFCGANGASNCGTPNSACCPPCP